MKQNRFASTLRCCLACALLLAAGVEAKGTKIECRSHFDNSPFNPYNPNPKATVKNGPQTHDEMMQGFFFYTDDSENLNLKVDPRTGKEIKAEAKTAAAQ